MLNHCVAHGYHNLVDAAALESLAHPIPEVARGLTYPGLLPRWVCLKLLPLPFVFNHDPDNLLEQISTAVETRCCSPQVLHQSGM